MKSLLVATALGVVAILPLAHSAGPAPTAPSSLEAPLDQARRLDPGETIKLTGRAPRRLARGTAVLVRKGGAGRTVSSIRVDARRRYVLRTTAPRDPGTYSYQVRIRTQRAETTVKRFTLTVVDPSSAPEPTAILDPVSGPLGDPDDWTYIGGARVVRWDPCSTITWSVTGAAPYAEGLADLDTAFARISAATGLTFVQVADPEASALDVEWTTAAARPVLAGSLVAWGGVSSYPQPEGHSKAVSGLVLLDVEHTMPGGFTAVGASWGKAMLHEMGHAVGLGHAAGAEQIMYSKVAATPAELGAGDLTGLRAVGAGQGCFAG